MDHRAFTLFGLSHWTALAATVIAAVWFIRLQRSAKVCASTKRRAQLGLALGLVLAVTADPILTWIRYRNNDPWKMVIDNSLPLYLCDVVSIVLAAALITRRQRLAEIGYLWGMGGTVQGLITPTLYFDWNTPEYFAFFIQHGGVPVAAAGLIWGMGLRPQPGAFRRAVLLSWVYMVSVMLINYFIGRNYGFLNGKPEVHTMMDYFGPEPWYLVTLNLVAFTLYLILLIPFMKEWRAQRLQPSC
jgi:hypothetical integral membrane protein (TIGR02206 family)